MKKYIERESYKHLYAKNLLAKWLRKIDENNDYCNFSQLNWRSNYGVFEELKFYETSDLYYFENSECLNGKGKYKDTNQNNWFDKNFNRGRILFVPDIAIFHKGTPIYFLEVVNSNPVSAEKLYNIKKFFDGYMLNIYEINASDILKYDKTIVPENLEMKLIHRQ